MSIVVKLNKVTLAPELVETFKSGQCIHYGEDDCGVTIVEELLSVRNVPPLTNTVASTVYDNGDMYAYHYLSPELYKLMLLSLDVEIKRLRHNGVGDPEFHFIPDLEAFRFILTNLSLDWSNDLHAVSWG